MSKIREELEARLEAIAVRREQEDKRHLAVLKGLEQEETVIASMLNLEKQLINGSEYNGEERSVLRPGAANNLESEILTALSDHRIWAHHDLKNRLMKRGLGAEDERRFGQSLQGTLLSMRARNLVEHAGDGVWKIGSKGMP